MVLLRGLKRRLEKAKGTWSEEIPRILWAYQTTTQSTTNETPFSLVYDTDGNLGKLSLVPEFCGGKVQRGKKGEPRLVRLIPRAGPC